MKVYERRAWYPDIQMSLVEWHDAETGRKCAAWDGDTLAIRAGDNEEWELQIARSLGVAHEWVERFGYWIADDAPDPGWREGLRSARA